MSRQKYQLKGYPYYLGCFIVLSIVVWPYSTAVSQGTETSIYNNLGYTVFTPGQVYTPGGGYATQATQAKQASQAKQATGYVSPYSPGNPYRPVLPTGPRLENPIPTYNLQNYNLPASITGTTGSGTLTGTVTTTKTVGETTTVTTNTIKMPVTPGTPGVAGTVMSTGRSETPSVSSGGNTLINVRPSTPTIVQNKPVENPSVIHAAPQAPTVITNTSRPSISKSSETPSSPASIKETSELSVVKESVKSGEGGESSAETSTEETVAASSEEISDTGDVATATTESSGEVVHHEEKKEKRPGMTLEQITAMRKASEERAKRNLVREDVAPITSMETVREWSGPNLNSLISQVGEMVTAATNNALAMVNKNLIQIAIDPDDIEEEAKKEDEAREKEKKKLSKKLKELRERLERERQRVKDEQEREKKDKRYKARKDAERKLDEEKKKLEKKNKKLKDKAEKHEKDGKGLDQEEKNLREIEQEMRRDGDPNCRSSACQNVRKLRAENQADKLKHMKSGAALQKEARQFNKDVKEHQNARQDLENLKDRGFGMNADEKDAHRKAKKVKLLAEQEGKIKQAMGDLKKQADWKAEFGNMTQDEADEFRRQMRGLEGLLEKTEGASKDAKKAAFIADSVALGLDAKAAENAYAPNIPREFQKQIDEARSVKGMPTDTLNKMEARYDKSLKTLKDANKALKTGEIPKGGSPKALSEFNQLSENYEKLDKEKRALWGQTSKLRSKADTIRHYLKFGSSSKKVRDELKGYSKDELKAQIKELEETEQDLSWRANELHEQSESVHTEMKRLLPEVETDLFRRHVGLFNTEVANGLPLGEDNKVDRKAFGNNVAAVADQQLQLAKVESELGGITKKLADFQNRQGLTAQQAQETEVLAFKRDQLKAQQKNVVTKLDELGVTGQVVDGKFIPKPVTRGGAITWNTSRDQVKNTLDSIIENRRKLAASTNKKVSLAGMPEEPEKTNNGSVQKILDKDKKALANVSAKLGGVLGAVAGEALSAKSKGVSTVNLVPLNVASQGAVSEAKSKEIIALEKSISNIDNNIEAVEGTMLVAKAHQVEGLELGLHNQREALFSTRAVLEAKLDKEKAKVKKEIIKVQTRARKGSKQAEELKQALTSLDLNISSFEAVEKALASSGQSELAQSYQAQQKALETSRSQVAKALEKQQATDREKLTTNPNGLNTIDRLLGRTISTNTPAPEAVKATAIPETALRNEKTAELTNAINSLNKSIETVEETMLATEGSNIPGLSKSLEGQREAMFTGRESLQKQLEDEKKKLKKQAEDLRGQSPAEQKEIAQKKAKPENLELALDENIKAFDTAAKHFEQIGNSNLAQVFKVNKAVLEKEKQRIQATKASYPREIKPSKEQVELEAIKDLVLWINKDVLPAFPKGDPALKLLPAIIAEATKRFGPIVTEQILDESLDELVDHGLEPDGAILIDALLKRISNEVTTSIADHKINSGELARLNFLKKVLTERKGRKDLETGYLGDSYADLKWRLEFPLEEHLRSKKTTPLSQLSALSGLLHLATFPGSEIKKIAPLIAQFERQLARLEKTQQGEKKGELNAILAEANASVNKLLFHLKQNMEKGHEKNKLTAELTKQLVRINDLRAQIFGRQFSSEKNKTQEQVRKEYASTRLEQVRNLVNLGNLAKALEILSNLESTDPAVKQSKALALIDLVTQIERRYGFLKEDVKQALGKLSDLRKQREGALAAFLEGTNNPKVFAGISLHWAERLLREGEFDKASTILSKALEKKSADPSLLALQARITLARKGEKVSEKDIKAVLGNIPASIGAEVGSLMLNSFVEKGNYLQAATLIKVLKSAEDFDEKTKKRLSVQLSFAEISVLASGLGSGQDDAELKSKIKAFQKRLLAIDGLGERYKNALIASTNKLVGEIDKATGWVENIDKSATSAAELGHIARRAVTSGRYDIAEKALKKQIDKLLSDHGPKEIGRGFMQAVRLLDGIRMRSQDTNLTKKQKEIFAKFLKSTGDDLSGKLAKYFKERIATASKTARVKEKKKQHLRSIQEVNLELRSLSQLKIRLDLMSVSPEIRVKKMAKLVSDATQEVSKKEAQILRAFDGLGDVLRDNKTTQINLEEQIAQLNALRSLRDGHKDYYIENAGNFVAPDYQMYGMNYGSFLPKTHREWEITTIHRTLAGVYANGKTAKKIWEERKHTRDFTVGRGLREKTLANHKNTPRERDYKANERKYRNHWLTLALDDAKLKYLDQRRAQLINEDRIREGSQRGKLYEQLINAESKYLRALVGTSNAFLEMFEKLAQTGRLMKGAARELEGRIVVNQQRLLIEEYETALIEKDAQRLFRAMIPLREASLAGELKSFVSYLHIDWYNAGPARAANLLGGMKDTQAELEEIVAESQKLNIALIRAGYNLPHQLSAQDKEILRTHGFLKGDVYLIPEQIVLDPTKVGSEFANKTQTGTLGTIDRFLNAKQAGELFATIAIPGGLAGKFGRWATTEVLAYGAVRSLGGKALAYGTGLVVEAGAFTLLNRSAQVALDPALLMKEGYWSSETLLKEYAHNLLIIGALKGFGAGAEGLAKSAQRIGYKRLAGLLKNSAIFGEAAVLTALNSMLESNQITQDEYLGNLITVIMLKGTGKVLEGKKKSPLQRLNEVRINRWLESIGKPQVPGTGPTTKVSQLRDAQIRHIEYVDWLLFVDKPTKILMERYNGDWDAARKDYQNGNLSAGDMRKLVNLRRQIVDNLANEIVQEIGGEVQAFGSENLTSDYDISFVGPKAALGVILFNARFANRWKMASEIGGRETGLVLDTNAYTETIQSLIEAGKKDVLFQDAFAHLSARKALPQKAWEIHKKWILDNTSESNRGQVAESLRLAEKYNADYRKAIEAQKELLRNDKENPIQERDVQITAENRLYEQALKDILSLREAFIKAKGAEKESLRQELRNAQSKALYFAQEAYYTQAAIEHVVFTIQAAKRSITVESLLADQAPKLKINLTPEQGRQSYFEQIAHMLHEIGHGGDPAKLASKGAKYFVRALDAAQIAGLKLESLEKVVRETVELNDNRADIEKVAEILSRDRVKAKEQELNRELTAEERTAIEKEAGLQYLADIQNAANALNAALYNQTSNLRSAEVKKTKGDKAELEFANDNVDPDKATAPQTEKPSRKNTSSAEVPSAPGSEAIKVEVSRPDLTAQSQKEFNYTDPTGTEHFLPLGEFLGSGSTSYVYIHAGNRKRIVRVTVAESWDARVLDEFGRFALEKLVDKRFIRIVERYSRSDVSKTSSEYFEIRDAQSIEVNERMENGTAEQIMTRQGGEMTKGQSLALDQAVRELNRRGLAWLDVKTDNYSFEKLPGRDRWRVVVLDPGGIVALNGKTARQRYDNAREVQKLINRPTVEQIEVWEQFRNARELVLNEIRQLVRENHRANFNLAAMKMSADSKVAFNPGGMMGLPEARRLFELTPEASNDNYLNHYGKPPLVKGAK